MIRGFPRSAGVITPLHQLPRFTDWDLEPGNGEKRCLIIWFLCIHLFLIAFGGAEWGSVVTPESFALSKTLEKCLYASFEN